MCLIAFAIGLSDRWPLVIAANRDEFLDRPTLPLARWQTISGQEILSGRDLRAGGTWMGMTPGGRIAFLTNVRESPPEAAGLRSRGELVTHWLESNCDARDFVAALEEAGATYAGFNLVIGDFQRSAWTWVTNRPAGVSGDSGLHLQNLPPGLYGLSNAALDTPWPKTQELKRYLLAALKANASLKVPKLEEALWPALGSRQRARPGDLPTTGVPLAMEEALSSAFVEFPEHAYGTRSSTVLSVSADSMDSSAPWLVQIEERTYANPPTGGFDSLPAHSALHRFTNEWRTTTNLAQSLGR